LAHSVVSAADWILKAVAYEHATVQVLLPGRDERLHVIASEGPPVPGGRRRSSRRREVFRSGRPERIRLPSPAGCSLAILPLIAGGPPIGVLEIVAPTETLDERREIIEAVVGQSAIIFRGVREQRESDAALWAMGAELRLAGELLRAETPVSAVRSAVRLCFEQLAVPVAGLLPDRSGTGWYVAAAHGIGAGRRAELRRSVDEVSVLTPVAPQLSRIGERFAAVLGRPEAAAVEAGGAIVLVAEPSFAGAEPMRTIASFLGEALDRIETVSWAEVRNENLDLAIAWTAHELRGPLDGARAALDQVTVGDADPGGRELIRRTRLELRQLADLVGPLLRWSAGSESLRMRPSDLGRIIRQAVASSCFEFADRTVTVDVPDGLTVRADGRELRGAVANVVRNAFAYSPPTSPVTVRVETRDDVVQVRVRDRGPGVPADQRHLIFDPFARGRAVGGTRGGRGLGLFIARRVVQAHGGTIGLRPVRPGAEFLIELPLVAQEGSPSAS
jgi:signal transduction histidine kinase